MKDLTTLYAEMCCLATLAQWAGNGMTDESSKIRTGPGEIYDCFFAIQQYLERIAEDISEVEMRLSLNGIAPEKLPDIQQKTA